MSSGFDNCLFSFYAEVSGKNGELFTAIHSLFSFFRGIAILSVGPVGTSILRRSPEIVLDAYAIGKYKVGYSYHYDRRRIDLWVVPRYLCRRDEHGKWNPRSFSKITSQIAEIET